MRTEKDVVRIATGTSWVWSEKANTCKTCKFWADIPLDDSTRDAFRGKGTCCSKKMVMCRDFELGFEMPDDLDILCHWGDHSYGSNINTGPDFGCIHHEPKEAQ